MKLSTVAGAMCGLALVLCGSIVVAQPDVGAVVERIKPGVVLVITLDQGGELHRLGSGFLISSDGWILTNRHVIEGAAAIGVRLGDESVHKAQLVKFESADEFDMALLKIEGSNFPFLVLGDSDAVQVLDYVIVIGYPLLNVSTALGTGIDVTVTDGKVSRVHRRSDGFEALQITAPVNAGNSGGPVVNEKGEVIGIATWAGKTSQDIQGFNLAISINVVKRLLLAGTRLTVPSPGTRSPAPPQPPAMRSDWPSAHITYRPLVVTVGTVVTFDATASSSGESRIISYAWDFDADGQPDATGPTVTRAFAEPGFASVTLTVTNAKGLKASRTITLLVQAHRGSSLGIPPSQVEREGEIAFFGYRPEEGVLAPSVYGFAIQASNRIAGARLLLEIHMLNSIQDVRAVAVGLEMYGKIDLFITKLYLGVGGGIPYVRALAGLEFDLWALRLYSEANYSLALNAIPTYQVKGGIGWAFRMP